MNEHPTASPEEIARWVEQLNNYRTRATARQNLIRAGAVDALIDCLHSRNESVVWAAARSLQSVPDPKAIPHLLDLLEKKVLPIEVTDTLKVITGRDCGLNANAWREALGMELGAEAKHVVESMDPAVVIQRAGDALGIHPVRSEDGNSYAFHLTFPSGRKQKVHVLLGRKDSEGDDLVMVYSPCAPADEAHYEEALRMNLRIPAGAIGITDLEEKPHFVMVDVLLLATLHSRQLTKAIEHVGKRADLLEESLTGKDVM